MQRRINPKKNHRNQDNEFDEMPLRTKRKEQKEKYRHQNNWLEDEDDFDLDEVYNLGEGEDDFQFEDEVDTFGLDFEGDYEEEEYDDRYEDDY